MTPSVLILNGPNLNLLGTREPEIYGAQTLADIEAICEQEAAALGLSVDLRQSNHEGDLVGWVQEAASQDDGLILNAGAYTHTSIALLDALRACPLPVIEVHLSNPVARDEFRRYSYVSLAATGIISGLGATGYRLALHALAGMLSGATADSERSL